MRTGPTNSLIDHLRRCVLLPDGEGLGDGELLNRFIGHHDEAAFAALVHRHGPMVWGVCRRLLHQHDAEDAFQATFLVLATKAVSIRSKEMLGNWLYGVAHQTALQARRTAVRRREREVQVMVMPDTEAERQDQWADVQPLLDDELSRLPEIYRAVIVMCDLEGRTRKEIARQLGVPEGTVAGRLARARAILAKRLTQRGVTLSGGAVAAVAAQQAAAAGVPKSVVVSTIKAASLLAAGKAAATRAVSFKVAALTEGVMKVMLFTKLKPAIAVMLLLGFVATGTTILFCQTAAGRNDTTSTVEKPAEPPAKQQKENGREPFTAWGKEVDGVQIGIQLGENRVYTVGESVTLIVRIRNNGKKEVPYSNGDSNGGEYFLRNPPLIADADGKPVKIKEVRPFALIQENSIAPRKETDLTKLSLALRPTRDRDKDEAWTLYGTGRFHVQYKDVPVVQLGPRRLDSGGPTLATGKLELEVTEPADKKPTAEEPMRPGAKRQKEKGAISASGKASAERPVVPVMTPKEIETKMDVLLTKVGSPYWDGPVAAECGVRSVTRQPVGTPDGKSYKNVGLQPDGDSTRFSIVLTPEAKAAMKRLGINNLEEHFRGKLVKVRGRIGIVSTILYASPSVHNYQLLIENLDQVVEVRPADTAAGKGPENEKRR